MGQATVARIAELKKNLFFHFQKKKYMSPATIRLMRQCKRRQHTQAYRENDLLCDTTTTSSTICCMCSKAGYH